MYTLKVNGSDKALDLIDYLQNQGWDFEIKIHHTAPFSNTYNIVMNDRQQMFMAQLAIGV
jgi:hypothetical protein